MGTVNSNQTGWIKGLSESTLGAHLTLLVLVIHMLTHKASIAADDKFCDVFPNFRQKEGMILHENLMKYHALLVIFEKTAKLEIVVCCKL